MATSRLIVDPVALARAESDQLYVVVVVVVVVLVSCCCCCLCSDSVVK